MSGFAGMISLDGAAPDRQLLEKMAARLAFRGPDGTHVRIQPGAGFCFTFLRTGPAPQCPSQPCSLDGRVWLLGDVRLDGRDDVRRKLEQSGEELCAAATDEELVLRTWRLWGEEGITQLIGDYAFALWDAEARTLRGWRDLMGARPFFYARAGGRLYFSNTLEAIRCAPSVSQELDRHFIGDFLLTDWCQYPRRTAFRDISRLEAGHLLRYAGDRLEVSRSTSLRIEEPLRLKREEEYVERFSELLERAVRERLPSGSTAVFMSGGLDSTSIAAIATKIAQRPGVQASLRAHTVDYRPLLDDEEGRYASLAARHLSMPIEIFCGASCIPYEGWHDRGFQMPEPCHEPFLSVSQQQYKRVRDHAAVALTGFGGDDVLSGQAWPYLLYLLRELNFVEITRAFGGYALKHGQVPPLRGGFRARLRRWMGQGDVMPKFPRWFEPTFVEEQNLQKRWVEIQHVPEGTHPLHPIAHKRLTGQFWSNVLESDDAAWTGAAVEMRAPLFDQRVLRYLLRVPPVPWCMHKELLRQAMRRLLPAEIRLRPKTPLLGDSSSLFRASARWNPIPLPEPTKAVLTFVNWQRLATTLGRTPNHGLWLELRPVSLNHWLKLVEKN